MKVNTKTELKALDGTVLVQAVKDDENPGQMKPESITFKTVAINALLIEDPKKPISGTDKLRYFKLAEKISSNDEVDLELDDAKLIKDRVTQGYGPLVVGRMVELLEGE